MKTIEKVCTKGLITVAILVAICSSIMAIVEKNMGLGIIGICMLILGSVMINAYNEEK